MKQILYLLAFVLLPFISTASHMLGGAITWRCLANGKYIFQMEMLRDCNGGSWSFHNETLDLVGNPLPRDTVGNAISSISLFPDSSRWTMSNFGDLSPNCDTSIGSRFSCANGDNGVAQLFYYQSAPIELNGVAPSTGWNIYWQGDCCRPQDLNNVNTSGSILLLRAIMYPDALGSTVNPCIDSSPEFRALPVASICRGQGFTFNHSAIDIDLDSLVYNWDRPFDAPISNPRFISYKNGYSLNNPTPDQNFNIDNVPSTLDPLAGKIRMAIFNGIGVEKYLTVVRVDAYRHSQRIASVFREMPIAVFDCPDLPGFSGVQNSPPNVLLDGVPASSKIITVVAGQEVNAQIQIVDSDSINVSPFKQEITLTPDGLLFTQSRGANSPCIISNPNVEPCAYLRNQDPFIDPSASPPVSVLKGIGTIGTEFVWQPNCNHIRTKTGFPGTNEGIYNFVMRVQDDHCPVPGINYPTITIRVKDPIPLTEPIMKGISIGLDGYATFNWVPPVDSVGQFNPSILETDHYEAYVSRTPAGQAVGGWVPLETNILNYQQQKRTIDLTPYDPIDNIDPNSPPDILRPFGSVFGQNFDFYVRMKTLSGCTDTNSSVWSVPAKVMNLKAEGAGIVNERDSVRLTWNRAKPAGLSTNPTITYESPTYFYVHVNDSILNGGVSDSARWYMMKYTRDTSTVVSTANCNDYSAYRIEARDTVIIEKQGTSRGQRNLAFDTLYFSTFSMIDSIFTTGGSPEIINVKNQYLQSSIVRSNYQWFNCMTNGLLSTSRQFTPQQPGLYRVSASNLSCADTSICFEVQEISDSIYSVNSDYLQGTSSGTLEHWISCADSSTVSTSGVNYVPNQPGTYAFKSTLFGLEKYSDCFIVTDIDTSSRIQNFDFFQVQDSLVNVQWYKVDSQGNQSFAGGVSKTFVPQTHGTYFANLQKYNYQDQTRNLIATELTGGVRVLTNSLLYSLDSASSYQWINCNTNVVLAGETNRTLQLTDTGTFAVLTKIYNYTKRSDCIPMKAVGIDERIFQNQVSFFPNPTTGIININLANQETVNIEIRNIQGQLVQEEQFLNQSSLELEINGKAGVYFIQLTNENGERANLKVVKR